MRNKAWGDSSEAQGMVLKKWHMHYLDLKITFRIILELFSSIFSTNIYLASNVAGTALSTIVNKA